MLVIIFLFYSILVVDKSMLIYIYFNLRSKKLIILEEEISLSIISIVMLSSQNLLFEKEFR